MHIPQYQRHRQDWCLVDLNAQCAFALANRLRLQKQGEAAEQVQEVGRVRLALATLAREAFWFASPEPSNEPRFEQ